jgi:hypothetical protein
MVRRHCRRHDARSKIATVERRKAPSRLRGTARVSPARLSRFASATRTDQCASRRSAHPSLGVGHETESNKPPPPRRGRTRKGKHEPGRSNAPRERRRLRCLTGESEAGRRAARAIGIPLNWNQCAANSVCSLPPCGGGLGRGVMRLATLVRQSHYPHPQPLPARGRGAHRARGTVLRQSEWNAT